MATARKMGVVMPAKAQSVPAPRHVAPEPDFNGQRQKAMNKIVARRKRAGMY